MALADFSGLLSKFVWITLIGAGVMLILGLVIGILVWNYRRKKWNLTVGVKMPRGKVLTISEIAKGHFDVKAGIVDIKRKGVGVVGMKPFDVREYLQGERYLEVLMLSPTDFLPIHPKSYEVVTTTKINKDGDEVEEKYVVVEIQTDLSKRKTWKTYFERTAKNRFTLKGFLDEHWKAIELGIIIFILFVGFAVLWSKIGG